MNKIKYLIFLPILGLLLFASYMFKYQQLVNEGSALAEEHCLKVNPVIEIKQQKALKYFNTIVSSSSAESSVRLTSTEFSKSAQDVVNVSSDWMKKQKEFLDRWDFQFFTSKEIKDLFYAQYDKYLADIDGNKFVVEYFNYFEDPTIRQRFEESIKRQVQTQLVLDEALKTAGKRSDIRWYFTKVPVSKCDLKEDYPSIPLEKASKTG